MSEHELDKKALDAALRDARAKGLPEGWTVKLDVRTEKRKNCLAVSLAILHVNVI